MILQLSLNLHQVCLSSTVSYSGPLPRKKPHFTLRQTLNNRKLPTTSSISQVHSYGTVDYEKRPKMNWNTVHKRISLMENPELGSGTVLNQCEEEGKKFTKWELCRVVKELRKFKRFKQALEVYDWMSNRPDRYRLVASDYAIQLDLVAKVRGISTAENLFDNLPDNLKDGRIHGALLNAYGRAKMKEKAESLIETMRNEGYVRDALPFNVMMTLYMNLKEYNKVDLMISEMTERNIGLDIYSYNIWLSCRGSQGSAEKMEEVFEQMKQDSAINPNWTTFCTMATIYIRLGQLEKAEDCLRKVESRITGRNKIPYHYLLSLYGNVGKREEVYRVWNSYKLIFPTIPNLAYHSVISSLVRCGDIKGAEKIFEEWLPKRSSYDPRIANLIIGWYVKEGNLDKAERLFDEMVEAGGQPNSNSWEILAEGHILERRISEALFCLKEALALVGSNNWKLKPENVNSFFKLCDQEGDIESKEVVVGLLRQSGHLKNEVYASLIGLSSNHDELSTERKN